MNILSVCSSYGMNPQAEQEKATFLSYIKKIFKLDDQQRFITLIACKVHMKLFFFITKAEGRATLTATRHYQLLSWKSTMIL